MFKKFQNLHVLHQHKHYIRKTEGFFSPFYNSLETIYVARIHKENKQNLKQKFIFEVQRIG